MLSLRKLADTEPNRMLYIERFRPTKLTPEFLTMTAEEYLYDTNKAYDEIFVAIEKSVMFSFADVLCEISNDKAVNANWVIDVISELGEKINISEFESVINKVLIKHKYYTAGEYVENDLLH